MTQAYILSRQLSALFALSTLFCLITAEVDGQRLMDDFKPIFKSPAYVRAIDVDTDGKIYLGGSITTVGQSLVDELVRINPDGSLDESFSPQGRSHRPIDQIIASNDSVILIVRGNSKMEVIKKSGSPEESFQLAGSIPSVFWAEIIGEQFLVASGQNNFGYSLYKINRDGSIDNSFQATQFKLSTTFTDFKVQPDGKILIAGQIKFTDNSVASLIRINENGQIDDAFEIHNELSVYLPKLELQSNGKILLSGGEILLNEDEALRNLLRFNTDGTLDLTFIQAPLSDLLMSSSPEVLVLNDDKMLVYGIENGAFASGTFNHLLLKLNSDGSIDDSFPTIDLIGRFIGSLGLCIGANEEIYLIGNFKSVEGLRREGFAAFDQMGNLLDINADIGGYLLTNDAFIQSDGKILLSGNFFNINNIELSGLARLNLDGTIDETFNCDIDFSDRNKAFVASIAQQSDGKILLGGTFIDVIGNDYHGLIRLEETGEIDLTFQAHVFTGVSDIFVMSNDDMIVGGTFSGLENYTRRGLAKLNSDGTAVANYNLGNVFASSDIVLSLGETAGNRLVAGGYNYSNSGFITAFDEFGNLDATYTTKFIEKTRFESGYLINEELFFIGSYSGGSSSNPFSPIYQVKEEDNELVSLPINLFHTDGGYPSIKSLVAMQGSDMIIGGSFNKINDLEVSGLAKISIDGTVDSNFIFDADGDVDRIIQEENGTALVFGSFNTINNVLRGGSSRIKLLNDIPVIDDVNTSLSIEEEGNVELSLSDLSVTDEDDSFPGEFTLVILEGENYSVSGQKVTPDLHFSGTLTVPVKVSDGKDDSEPYNLSIEVTPVNDTPVVTGLAGALSLDENTSLTLSLENFTITDPDNTFPNDFTLILEQGDNYTLDGLKVVPDAGFNGTLMVKAKVSDGESTSDVFLAEVTVVSTNVAPVIDGATSSLSTPEETALTISINSLTVTDPDDTFPGDFSLSIEAGDNYAVAGSTITPATDFNGTLAVPVKVNDGEADSPAYELSVSVTPVNDIPVVTAYTGTVVGNEDSPLTFSLDGFSVTDPDNSFPADFSFSLEAGDNYTVNGTSIVPALNYSGSLSVAARVSDGAATSASYLIAVTIQPVNDTPVVSAYSGTVTTPEETALTIDLPSLTVVDPDNSFPGDFTLTILAGDNYTIAGLQVIPAENFNGAITVPVKVSDGSADSEAFNLTVDVTPVNDTPFITGYSGPLAMDENTLLALTLEDFTVIDPDNEFPADFALSLNPGENYTTEGTSIVPNTDFSGELSLDVVVSDGTALSQPFGITVTVNEVTGIMELESEISLFPVPVTSELTLRINNSYQGVVTLKLIDLSGNLVLTKRFTKKGQTLESAVDLRSVPRGLYVVQVDVHGEGIVSKRVVVE